MFVFYSGHGIPAKTGDEVYLFPSDGKISSLETRGYGLTKMYENLKALGSVQPRSLTPFCAQGFPMDFL